MRHSIGGVSTPIQEDDRSAINPRRPLDDSNPDGYKESDKDFVLNNLSACVVWLESKENLS